MHVSTIATTVLVGALIWGAPAVAASDVVAEGQVPPGAAFVRVQARIAVEGSGTYVWQVDCQDETGLTHRIGEGQVDQTSVLAAAYPLTPACARVRLRQQADGARLAGIAIDFGGDGTAAGAPLALAPSAPPLEGADASPTPSVAPEDAPAPVASVGGRAESSVPGVPAAAALLGLLAILGGGALGVWKRRQMLMQARLRRLRAERAGARRRAPGSAPDLEAWGP